MKSQTKVAIITGAGSGIGKAVATALLNDGWNTVFVGRRLAPLEGALSAAEAENTAALAISCDVSKADEVDALFAKVLDTWGRVDLLFNNAGIGYKLATIDEIPIEAWNDVLAINLTGSFLCARAAFAAMKKQTPQGGRIINNGSVSAHVPRPGSAPYTVSKHAITGLTKTLALDGREFDIACGQIDIGNVLTDMALPMTVGMPQANGTISPEALFDVVHVADAVLSVANLPLDVNVPFMTIMANKMPLMGRG